MSKICTSLEQSKQLIELGIDTASADMMWTALNWQGTEYYMEVQNNGFDMPKSFIYAWSLDALLGYVKDRCGYFELVYLSNTSDGRGNRLENVYRLSTDLHDVYAKEILDAVYEMVCWLKENDVL